MQSLLGKLKVRERLYELHILLFFRSNLIEVIKVVIVDLRFWFWHILRILEHSGVIHRAPAKKSVVLIEGWELDLLDVAINCFAYGELLLIIH